SDGLSIRGPEAAASPGAAAAGVPPSVAFGRALVLSRCPLDQRVGWCARRARRGRWHRCCRNALAAGPCQRTGAAAHLCRGAGMKGFWTLLQRDLLLAAREGGATGTALGFYLIVIALMPLGLGPDMQ